MLAGSLVFASGLAWAAPIEVTLAVEGAKPAQPLRGVLSFHRKSAPPPGESRPDTVEVAAELPGAQSVDLPPGDWDLAAKVPGYWARSIQVTAGAVGGTVALTFFPASAVGGQLKPPADQPMPREVTLRFSSVAGASPRRFRNTEVTCPVTGGAFRCDLPAGELDLRVRARGFISHYRWGMRLESGKTLGLGDLALRRGASLSGWVTTFNGTRLAPSCQATLAPRATGLARGAADLDRNRKLALAAPVQPSGFFHFEGVPVGSYVLAVAQPGFAAARLYPVQVLENAETEVRQPLVLRAETSLSVFLDPATDTHGERWRLDLLEVGPTPGFHERSAEGTAEMDGSWRVSGVAPGRYLLRIGHLPDSVFETREVEVEPQGTTVQVSLPVIWVEGRVRLGKKPLQATLWFGGRTGMTKVRIDTDTEGRFTDVLPREGKWSLTIDAAEHDIERNLRAVEIRRPEGKKTVRLDIDLPDTHLAGKVVDEQGRPAPGAAVTLVKAQDLESPATLETDPKGLFHFAGLEPGRYNLQARRTGGGPGAPKAEAMEASEVAEVAVAEDHPADPEPVLVLLRNRTVEGQVTAAGQGVPQARIEAVPRLADGSVPMYGRPTTTDVEGRFRLELPARTASLDLVVLPPGFTMRMLHVPLGEKDAPLAIAVEPGGGGTLVLEAEGLEGGDPEDQPVLSVIKDQVGVRGGLLTAWASLQGMKPQPGKWVVPSMEPGAYQACLTRIVGYQRSAGPPRGTVPGCVSGILQASGELKLKLKAPEAKGPRP